MKYACTFIPQYFNRYIFGIGELMHLEAIVIFYRKMWGK